MIEYRYCLGQNVCYKRNNKIEKGIIKTFIHNDHECYGVMTENKLNEVSGKDIVNTIE